MFYIKVSDAIYAEEHKIELSFTDGVSGIVDLSDYLEGPIFEPLKDINYFKNFNRDRWTICWENGADFAPEFLHELTIKQNKEKSIILQH